jgi:glycosyltransferase involved in cell wall biosynthesis
VSCEVVPLGSAALDIGRATRSRLRAGLVAVPAALGWILALRRALRRVDADIAHTNTLKANVLGGIAARSLRRPVVWHQRDLATPGSMPAVAAMVVRGLATTIPTIVVASSAATAATLPRRARTVVVHSPVAMPRAQPVRVPSARFTVAVVGRLARWKGQDLFVRAFAAAFPDGDERAIVVGSAMFPGDDEFEHELRALVTDLELGDRVAFTGFVDDVYGVLATVDVVVHCSVQPEPFGLVVVQAMAAGLAVIAAGEGGPTEVIEDGVTGVLVAPRDPSALEAALTRLRSDPTARADLGARAEAAVDAFAPASVAARLAALYRDCAARAMPSTT